MDVSGRRQGQVDGREQEVRDGQGDDEHRGGVAPKFGTSGQSDNCQQVT